MALCLFGSKKTFGSKTTIFFYFNNNGFGRSKMRNHTKKTQEHPPVKTVITEIRSIFVFEPNDVFEPKKAKCHPAPL